MLVVKREIRISTTYYKHGAWGSSLKYLNDGHLGDIYEESEYYICNHNCVSEIALAQHS